MKSSSRRVNEKYCQLGGDLWVMTEMEETRVEIQIFKNATEKNKEQEKLQNKQ